MPLLSVHLSSLCPGIIFPQLFFADPKTGLGVTPLCAHGTAGFSWGSSDHTVL